MKRYRTNGMHIKELREKRERRATQKEFAYELRISERLLREIENRSVEIGIAIVERIAKALAVPRQAIAFGLAPQPAASEQECDQCLPQIGDDSGARLVPRFDTQIASVAWDESYLFDAAKNCHLVVSHLLTKLTPETRFYAEEMLALLDSVSWERRGLLYAIPGPEELRVRGRLHELLVLLKGNDVWVYTCTHLKRLPESDALMEESAGRQFQMQVIVAFGPPGQYGEDTLHVPVDHGQPWLYDPDRERV